jgi:hypothetical protein
LRNLFLKRLCILTGSTDLNNIIKVGENLLFQGVLLRFLNPNKVILYDKEYFIATKDQVLDVFNLPYQYFSFFRCCL